MTVSCPSISLVAVLLFVRFDENSLELHSILHDADTLLHIETSYCSSQLIPKLRHLKRCCHTIHLLSQLMPKVIRQ